MQRGDVVESRQPDFHIGANLVDAAQDFTARSDAHGPLRWCGVGVGPPDLRLWSFDQRAASTRNGRQMTAGDSVKRHRNIVALVGSLRRDSYNRMLFNAALELAPPEMTITELTGWQQWPLLNLDEVADGMLEPVTQMARQITESDGVLFVSPEYNYSIPGGLKNTIDWLSRVDPQPFAGKAVGLMGAATGAVGTARMQYQLRQTLVFLDGHPINKPEVMVARAAEAFDGNGTLINEFYRTQVAQLLEALAGQADRFVSYD